MWDALFSYKSYYCSTFATSKSLKLGMNAKNQSNDAKMH